MVPNSLGPSLLINRYGTQDQNYYLPKLATGELLPCFAHTSLYSGSDATSITDTAEIIKIHNKLKFKINANKRYITLAPIANLIGIAVKLKDPNTLYSNKKELGIAFILIETEKIKQDINSKRHIVLSSSIHNGTIVCNDLIIPTDNIIGGLKNAQLGWKMLIECLSLGRGISLPCLANAQSKLSTLLTLNYASIREQFKKPIIQFEGIEEKIADMMTKTYSINATLSMTENIVQSGKVPSVISAISKYYCTEQCRSVVNHAMDIHAGKAIIAGNKNYMEKIYNNIPIMITVEGSNTLTRNLMIFGQGAIKSHSYIYKELILLKGKLDNNNIDKLNTVIYQHLLELISHIAKASWQSLMPKKLYETKPVCDYSDQYKEIIRLNSCFCYLANTGLIHLGGKLKHNEYLSENLLTCLLAYTHAIASWFIMKTKKTKRKPFSHMQVGFKQRNTTISASYVRFYKQLSKPYYFCKTHKTRL